MISLPVVAALLLGTAAGPMIGVLALSQWVTLGVDVLEITPDLIRLDRVLAQHIKPAKFKWVRRATLPEIRAARRLNPLGMG